MSSTSALEVIEMPTRRKGPKMVIEDLVPDPAPAPEPEAAAASTEPALSIVYPKVECLEYSIDSPRGPLTSDDIDVMMGWETEEEYQRRMVQENGGELTHYLYGDVFHCLDEYGKKVRCHNNAGNRSFDEEWCEYIIDMVLNGVWAGPLMMPGETINGETIRISRYGRVLSGQHQMTACKRANQRLQKLRAKSREEADQKYPAWKDHEQVVIETLVVLGLSEDERILRTIDYVKPRTVADMLYTMPLFRGNTPVERKEMTRMTSAAIDTLWARTATKGYKTHPEVVGFLERHKRLLKCVEHLFVLNKPHADDGRRISKHRISPGICSALKYLMASAGPKTEGDVYRNEFPPSEKGLDWSLWDKAEEFWELFAKHDSFEQVRHALGKLLDSLPTKDDNIGLGGRIGEKLAILSRAWSRWKDHPDEAGDPFDDSDLAEDGLLSLSYTDLDEDGKKLPAGQVTLIDTADFFGIDCPKNVAKDPYRGVAEPPPPSAADIMRMAEEARARRAQGIRR